MTIAWTLGALRSDYAVDGASSEVAGYEAENAIVMAGLSCGQAWKATSDTAHTLDMTFDTGGSSLWGAICHSNIPDERVDGALATTVSLYEGTAASPGDLLGEFHRVGPQNQWVMFASPDAWAGGAAFLKIFTSVSAFALELPLLLFGNWRDISQPYLHSSEVVVIDPSQTWSGPTGRVWARQQRLQHELRAAFEAPAIGQDERPGTDLLTVQDVVSGSALYTPVVISTKTGLTTRYDVGENRGTTMVGLLQSMPSYPTRRGSIITNFDLAVRELSR